MVKKKFRPFFPLMTKKCFFLLKNTLFLFVSSLTRKYLHTNIYKIYVPLNVDVLVFVFWERDDVMVSAPDVAANTGNKTKP